jgi:hypothetical protein
LIPFSTLACIAGLRSYVLETDLPPNLVKYKYCVGNSVCQLSRLMEHNLRVSNTAVCGAVTVYLGEDARAARRVRVPTFVAPSYGDRRISPTATLEFAGSIPAPVLMATFGKAEDRSVPVLANGGKVRRSPTPSPSRTGLRHVADMILAKARTRRSQRRTGRLRELPLSSIKRSRPRFKQAYTGIASQVRGLAEKLEPKSARRAVGRKKVTRRKPVVAKKNQSDAAVGLYSSAISGHEVK